MNKRFWMAFAACWVVGQVFGFGVHGVLLDATYKSMPTVWRPEAEMNSMMWLMFVSSALMVFAFCYIFTKGHEGKGVMEGVRYGLLIGLLYAIPTALDQHVIYPVPLDLAVKWIVAGLIYFVLIGAVLAAIYKPDAAKA